MTREMSFLIVVGKMIYLNQITIKPLGASVTGVDILFSSAEAGPVTSQLYFVHRGPFAGSFSSSPSTHGMLRKSTRVDANFS